MTLTEIIFVFSVLDQNYLTTEAAGSLFKCKWHCSLFNDIPPHEPPLHASSSPIPRIPIWFIDLQASQAGKRVSLVRAKLKQKTHLSLFSKQLNEFTCIRISKTSHFCPYLFCIVIVISAVTRTDTTSSGYHSI